MHAAEQLSITEEGRVGSSDCVEGTQGTLSILGTTEEVISTAPVEPAGLSTIMLPPVDGTEAMVPSSLDDAGLETSHELERVDTADHLLFADGARIANGVGSSGAAA